MRKNTPKKFDIVYVDACAPLVSDQHALRCISSLFKYHRLESPGVLISNFADVDQSNSQLREEFEDIIARYFYIKETPSSCLVESQGNIFLTGYYEKYKTDVSENFERYYGDFITAMTQSREPIDTIQSAKFHLPKCYRIDEEP